MFQRWGWIGLMLLVVGAGGAMGAGPGAPGPGGTRIHPRRGAELPSRGEHARARAQAPAADDVADEAAAEDGEGEGFVASRHKVANPWKVALASRQWRNALPGLRAAIAANPDDPNLQAYLGTVNSRIGRYGDAAADFELAVGSDIYEKEGVERHADALRYTGHPEEAYELRRSAWLMEKRRSKAIPMVVGMIDDLRYAGDYEQAYDWAWYLIGEVPGMEEAYAVAADVALDMGDLDEADSLLWSADLYGHRVARTRAARGRAELMRGEPAQAYEEVRYGRMRNRNHMPWAIQAEALRRQGGAEEALLLLSAGHLPDQERPEMVAAKLASLASAGELEEARELRRVALWMYPSEPDVLAASRVLDLAEERARTER